MTNSNEFRMQAAIFDLDGLLIDSEPLWQIAEVEVLSALGVPLTAAMCHQTVGLRIEEAIDYWWQRYHWAGPAPGQVAERVVERMIQLISETGSPMPGALAAVEAIQSRGIPVAIATSSPRRIAEVAVARLGLAGVLSAVCTAEGLPHGKPHPAVYLEAAIRLELPAVRCLAFEDSINGMISAKAARMGCVVVPYPQWRDDPRFMLADHRLDSLTLVTADWVGRMFETRDNAGQPSGAGSTI